MMAEPRKKAKVHKKVSFDTRVHRANFARKSHHGLVRQHGVVMRQRRMVLRIPKLDIAGYIPDPGNGHCARLIPVEEVLSCSRTNPANPNCRKTTGAALHSVKSNKRLNGRKRKVESGESSSSNCTGVIDNVAAEPTRKKNKVDRQDSEPEGLDEQPLQPCMIKEEEEELVPKKHDHGTEVEYALKLNETIEKITGNSTKKKKKKKRSKDHTVRYPLTNIGTPMPTQSQSCSLDVKTVNITLSKSVQADSGFIVDKEVMDSYVDVKINEALYDMKEVLQNVEERFSEVIKEKARMETVLKEKVQLIRELTRKDYKVQCADKSVATDGIEIGPLPTETTKPKSPKRKRRRCRHVATQTSEQDHACLQPMLATSLAPYLKLRSTSSGETDNESEAADGAPEVLDKVEWLFQKSHSSARCLAIRPQVRLLRALKNNLAQHRSIEYASKYKDILPDAVGWDSLGPELQNIFTSIFKLCHILEMLPVEAVLIDSRAAVVRSLTHLLSHLPIPNSVTQTLNMTEINRPRTVAMASYLFGWKVKEVIFLLRTAYHSSSADILPDFFKAELCRADRISYDSLKFALQGIRNTAIPHGSLSSDSDFVTSSGASLSNWFGLGDEGFSDSGDSDFSDSDEDPIPLKQVRRVKQKTRKKSSSGNSSPQVASAAVSDNEDETAILGLLSKKSTTKKVSTAQSIYSLQPPTMKSLYSALGDQPVVVPQVGQSRVAKHNSNPSEACIIQRAVSHVPTAPSLSAITSSVLSRVHVQLLSPQTKVELAALQQLPKSTLPVSAGGRVPQQWKLDKSSGLPIWQNVNQVTTTTSTVQHCSLPTTTTRGQSVSAWSAKPQQHPLTVTSTLNLPATWALAPGKPMTVENCLVTPMTGKSQSAAATNVTSVKQPATMRSVGSGKPVTLPSKPVALISVSRGKNQPVSVSFGKNQPAMAPSVHSDTANDTSVMNQPATVVGKNQAVSVPSITSVENQPSVVTSATSVENRSALISVTSGKNRPGTTSVTSGPVTVTSCSNQPGTVMGVAAVSNQASNSSSNLRGSHLTKRLASGVEVPQISSGTAKTAASNRSTNNNIDTGIQLLGPALPEAVVVSMTTPSANNPKDVVNLVNQLPAHLPVESANSSLDPKEVDSSLGMGPSSPPSPSYQADSPSAYASSPSSPAHAGCARPPSPPACAVQVLSPSIQSQLFTSMEKQAWNGVRSHLDHSVQAQPHGNLQLRGVPPWTQTFPSHPSGNLKPPLQTQARQFQQAPVASQVWGSQQTQGSMHQMQAWQSQQAYNMQESQAVSAHRMQASGVQSKLTRIMQEFNSSTALWQRDSGPPPMDYQQARQPCNSNYMQDCGSMQLHRQSSGGLRDSDIPVGIHPLHLQPSVQTITVQERISQIHSYGHGGSNSCSIPPEGAMNGPQRPYASMMTPSPTLNPQVHSQAMNISSGLFEFLKKLECYRPIIIGGARKVNNVFMQWTFPGGIESLVYRYDIFYTTKPLETEADFDPQWKRIGSVSPLPLPMCVTLSSGRCSEQCFFTVQALFPNGCSSQKSAPLTL